MSSNGSLKLVGVPFNSATLVFVIDNVVLEPGSSIRAYASSTWLFIMLLNIAAYWWAFWALRDGIAWTQIKFLYAMAGPGLLVLATHVLLPNDPDTVESLEDHFFRVRKRFFGLMFVVSAWAMSAMPVFFGDLSPNFVPQVVFVTISVTGFVVAERRTHRWLAITMAVTVIATIFVTRAQQA